MSDADTIRVETHWWVRDAVDRRRAAGFSRAVEEVSRLYGIGRRRVVQYLRNEVRRPPADEYLMLRHRARLDIEAWARKSDADAAELRARLAEWSS